MTSPHKMLNMRVAVSQTLKRKTFAEESCQQLLASSELYPVALKTAPVGLRRCGARVFGFTPELADLR